MSYEGYTQVLCANGHLHNFDCYDTAWSSEADPGECYCGAGFVFSHEVDTTNDSGTPMDFEIDKPAVREMCNLGHVHVTQAQTYKIPEKP